ncbi:MAG: hypothetical protein ABSG80_16965 [Verrucomicrobiota bacterium]|jgi:hypothetical protein
MRKSLVVKLRPELFGVRIWGAGYIFRHPNAQVVLDNFASGSVHQKVPMAMVNGMARISASLL